MSIFQFKSFTLDQNQCGMKISTDAVILGVWSDFSNDKTLLDIGTGTGLLSLIAAQKNKNLKVIAVEIEKDAANQAKNNFLSNRWKERMIAEHIDFFRFASSNHVEKFDHVICNPPFYESGKYSAIISPKRSMARVNDQLPFSKLFETVDTLMHHQSKFSILVPFTEKDIFIEHSKPYFHLNRTLHIFPKPHKKVNRVLMEFGKNKLKSVTESLTIRNTHNRYTEAFLDMHKDFYLFC